MTFEQFGVKPGQHIPGQVVHDYLTAFANNFNLMPRMRLNQKVLSAELLNDGSWLLRLVSTKSHGEGPVPETLVASKLVVATGLTSEPQWPVFEGREHFKRELFHAKELKDRTDSIERAKSVVVLGGNKSAWDTCFFAAKCGAHVHMVMRPGGGGPSWVWPLFFSPFKVSVQRLASTRFFTWFDPCIWSEETGLISWIRAGLHNTCVGRWIVSKFWNCIGSFAHKAHRYDDHPETRKLKPWVSPFWMGNSLSIHNYTSSWFELVRQGRITVHIADVVRLSEGTVHLSDGEDVAADAFVCCTGWKTRPPILFLPDEVAGMMLPRQGREDDQELSDRARRDVFARIPALKAGPKRTLPDGTVQGSKHAVPDNTGSPYRLYRFLIPLDERSLQHRNIAFIGSHLALNATMIAQIQALWVTAFFMNEIDHLKPKVIDQKEVRYSAFLHSEYGRIRHPHIAGGAGERCPDLAFDCLPYMDLLLSDLGLHQFRKSRETGIWSEIFHRYGPSDYVGLVQEWLYSRVKTAGGDGRG
ncbi:hypothetical protein JDV02_010295 [Purpureocillium takamizusanense]|uniref:L-ornithine N(5)-oxygenase n=1 Tax=Purpureocillium takamizusanense TaxID=2060973 RepID=A0A9Q8VF27_9HYPO|nr:uncharacterized protein JDV02_010295 [Purpureocillium takamizusanense]UNI24560.1 hypothetical protein JDV02_010295 [Purpureocillium takamizusanense]